MIALVGIALHHFAGHEGPRKAEQSQQQDRDGK
jgi:hypothetical protein